MENEETQAQEEVVEQEEQHEEETVDEVSQETEEQEDTVTLSKAEYKKLDRQSRAYQAIKTKPTATLKTEEATYTVSPDRLERIELMQDGYSREEVDEIMDLGGRRIVDSKLVQSAIKAMRNEKKSKEASPALTSKSPVYKKFTQEDLSNMSASELAKILPRE